MVEYNMTSSTARNRRVGGDSRTGKKTSDHSLEQRANLSRGRNRTLLQDEDQLSKRSVSIRSGMNQESHQNKFLHGRRVKGLEVSNSKGGKTTAGGSMTARQQPAEKKKEVNERSEQAKKKARQLKRMVAAESARNPSPKDLSLTPKLKQLRVNNTSSHEMSNTSSTFAQIDGKPVPNLTPSAVNSKYIIGSSSKEYDLPSTGGGRLFNKIKLNEAEKRNQALGHSSSVSSTSRGASSNRRQLSEDERSELARWREKSAQRRRREERSREEEHQKEEMKKIGVKEKLKALFAKTRKILEDNSKRKSARNFGNIVQQALEEPPHHFGSLQLHQVQHKHPKPANVISINQFQNLVKSEAKDAKEAKKSKKPKTKQTKRKAELANRQSRDFNSLHIQPGWQQHQNVPTPHRVSGKSRGTASRGEERSKSKKKEKTSKKGSGKMDGGGTVKKEKERERPTLRKVKRIEREGEAVKRRSKGKSAEEKAGARTRWEAGDDEPDEVEAQRNREAVHENRGTGRGASQEDEDKREETEEESESVELEPVCMKTEGSGGAELGEPQATGRSIELKFKRYAEDNAKKWQQFLQSIEHIRPAHALDADLAQQVELYRLKAHACMQLLQDAKPDLLRDGTSKTSSYVHLQTHVLNEPTEEQPSVRNTPSSDVECPQYEEPRNPARIAEYPGKAENSEPFVVRTSPPVLSPTAAAIPVSKLVSPLCGLPGLSAVKTPSPKSTVQKFKRIVNEPFPQVIPAPSLSSVQPSSFQIPSLVSSKALHQSIEKARSSGRKLRRSEDDWRVVVSRQASPESASNLAQLNKSSEIPPQLASEPSPPEVIASPKPQPSSAGSSLPRPQPALVLKPLSEAKLTESVVKPAESRDDSKGEVQETELLILQEDKPSLVALSSASFSKMKGSSGSPTSQSLRTPAAHPALLYEIDDAHPLVISSSDNPPKLNFHSNTNKSLNIKELGASDNREIVQDLISTPSETKVLPFDAFDAHLNEYLPNEDEPEIIGIIDTRCPAANVGGGGSKEKRRDSDCSPAINSPKHELLQAAGGESEPLFASREEQADVITSFILENLIVESISEDHCVHKFLKVLGPHLRHREATAVREYIDVLFREVENSATGLSAVLRRLNTPIGHSDLNRLMLASPLLPEAEQELLTVFEYEPVLDIKLYIALEERFRENEYKRRGLDGFEMEKEHIAHKMLFDALNESLDYSRRGGIGGLGLRYSRGYKEVQAYTEDQVRTTLAKSQQEVEEWHTVRAGVHMEKEPQLSYTGDVEALEAHREQRMRRLIEEHIRQGDAKWRETTDEFIEVFVLLSDFVFERLVDEMLQDMSRLLPNSYS